jgi:formate hydrogenlyase subunit 3/multisubunit Na+/H+ antiporter MnhD subunit
MEKIIIGVVCIGAGLYFALGIWLARFRARWGRTPLICGRLSHVGFVLFPGALGMIMITFNVAAMKPFRPVFILLAAAGFNIAMVGGILDRRAYCRGVGPRLPKSVERKAEGLQNFSPEALLIFGILFFLFLLWCFIFHPE